MNYWYAAQDVQHKVTKTESSWAGFFIPTSDEKKQSSANTCCKIFEKYYSILADYIQVDLNKVP